MLNFVWLHHRHSSWYEGRQIFNGKTFLTFYTSNLANSKRSILISSPKLYNVERSVVVNQLCELLCRGHEVLILTSQSNEQTEYLLSRGLSVKIKSDLSISTTIIDKSIVWYGAINALGYMSEDDNAIKVTDNNLANDLIEVLLSWRRCCWLVFYLLLSSNFEAKDFMYPSHLYNGEVDTFLVR